MTRWRGGWFRGGLDRRADFPRYLGRREFVQCAPRTDLEMPGRRIIVIGASAGSMEALREVCGGLPRDLPAAVFVVVHTGPSSPRVMPQVLDKVGGIPADYGRDNESISMGRIYIAPPDRHMLLTPRHIEITAGPKENGFRPAVDPLFRSAARAFGKQVCGVILSGGLDDGSEGMREIKAAGGAAIVQDPEQALFRSMPMNAILHVEVDHVLRSQQIPAMLVELANRPAAPARERTHMKTSKRLRRSIEPAEGGEAALYNRTLLGPPSGLTCPECGGALWELRDGDLIKYRCHVGHGYSEEAMVNNQDAAVEAALWAAVRALEEKAALRQRMADRARKGNLNGVAHHYVRRARHAHEQARSIRNVLSRSLETGDGGGGGGGGGNGKNRGAAAKKKLSSRKPC